MCTCNNLPLSSFQDSGDEDGELPKEQHGFLKPSKNVVKLKKKKTRMPKETPKTVHVQDSNLIEENGNPDSPKENFDFLDGNVNNEIDAITFISKYGKKICSKCFRNSS